MDRMERTARGRRRSLGGAVALLLLAVTVAPAAAACAPRAPDGSGGAAAMPTMKPAGGSTAAAALPAGVVRVDAAAMWASRPDFVRADATTEAAYHYAIEHPEVVAWMPCYCGCDAMEHRSNLDCYLKATGARFEEHASYCRICVDITLKAKDLVAQGKGLREVRTMIDATWGGTAPGTQTELPPA